MRIRVRTLIVFIIFVLFLGQLTPRVDYFKVIYQIDLATSLQLQFAVTACVLSALLGFWNRALMFTLLLLNALVIAANFNGYINIDFLAEQKDQLVSRTDKNELTVAQYTFDDTLTAEITETYKTLAEFQSDILVLFNVNDLHKQQLKELSEGRFSYGLRQKEGLASNIAVITRFPIESKRRNSFIEYRGDIIELNLLIKGQQFRLTVMHPPKPNSKLNWQQRNLMINTLEAMENRESNVLPYSLIVAELYTTIWSRHFPKLNSFRSCAYGQGVYGTWFVHKAMKKIGNIGAINTSHCFFSYRLKLSELETTQITDSENNLISYRITLQN